MIFIYYSLAMLCKKQRFYNILKTITDKETKGNKGYA